MKWKKPGLSSIRSSKPSTPRRTRPNCISTRPARGGRKQPMNYWRGMAGPGEDCKMGLASPVETFSPGLPVAVGKIEKELKKLWEQNEGATRASLVNLAVYSEAPNSLPANTKLIFELTQNLACRAIVIAADPGQKKNQVEAWISAHCHVSRAGSKQICSEQLSFQLEGPCANLLANIVFSHLDS